MPQRRQQGKPARTVLEQKIWERGETLAEFVEYAERFARQVGERGTLSERNLKRLVAGSSSNSSPIGQPRPATSRLLERIFGLPVDILLGSPNSSHGADKELQEELRQLLHVSGRLDAPLLAVLQDQLHAIRRLDRQLGTVVTRDEVTVKCQQVASLLTHSTTISTRSRLAALLSEFETLAGWQALDAGDVSNAWHHYEQAKGAARESGLVAFETHAAAEQAFVLLEIGKYSAANDLLAETRKRAEKKTNNELRAWLAAAHGEALAALGESLESLCAFDRAIALLPAESSCEDDPYVALDPIHLNRWRGHALTRLSRPEAVDVLSSALKRLDPTFARAEASLRTDLASAFFHRGEYEGARNQATQAHILASDIGSLRQLRRLNLLQLTR
ncbi:hypothetical protein [Amycolatopsis taiwanensis]|uniref:Uncharacterized protein n=1 Tax=Amycolatopsis taiwanensis TaxID=342230 RepID=A0A9W6R7P4_9PSEU|nr:hypothetical protein [Amycolatopsis taiwanensis]GLY70901.1 hypothetical protein Atai01_75200 [Amycolatopsis taiwanensis]